LLLLVFVGKQAVIAVCRDNSCIHSTRPAVPERLCDVALFTQWTQSPPHQWLHYEADETWSVQFSYFYSGL